MARVCALAAILGLIFGANFFGVFFNSPNEVPQAQAQALCQADVDAVLIIDRSGSMDYTSRCDWWQLKCVDSPSCTSYEWVKNITYNQTQSWCNSKNQSAPHESVWLDINPKKIDAAKDAADYFVGLMGTGDQSGLVSYANSATLDKGLSNNHSATQSAIDSLAAVGATNIGDAIKSGTQELRSGRANSQAVKAMILLTDGKANKPNGPGYGEYAADVAYAEAKAAEAAAFNFKIFTIGLGDNGEINETMLQNIANATGADYYHSPTQNDLQAIYDEIASRLCQYGSISGCKYSDINKDGNISGEEKLSGWEIKLNNDDNLSQLTDDSGCYQFSGLAPGAYTVSEGGKTGVISEQTYPAGGFYNINLAEGESAINKDFGNYLPFCGNAILDSSNGEVCEINQTQSCATSDGYQGIKNCNQDCFGWGACVPSEFCGDGIVNNGEECDGQAGAPDHYTCTASCALEYIPYCGDSIVNQTSEQCDGNSEACVTQSGYSGTRQCSGVCSWGGCSTNQSCGDGIKNGPEICDDNGNNGQYGYCNSDCTGQTPAICGNNQTEGGEQCDDGNITNGDGCSSVCQTETPSEPSVADLAVTKSVSTSTVEVGQNIIFTIGVTNLGPDPAPGVALSDLLPLGLTFVSASSTPGAYSGSTGVWTIGDMVKDLIATLELSALVNSQAQPGAFLTNNASTSLSIDPNSSNNSASAQVRVQSSNQPLIDLSVTKIVSKAIVDHDDLITFTIVATNQSATTSATNVSAGDLLPAGLAFNSATSTLGVYDSSAGVWTIGALAANSSGTLTIFAKVGTNSPGQVITNIVKISSLDFSDSNPSDNEASASVTMATPAAPPSDGGGGVGGGGDDGGGGGNGPLPPSDAYQNWLQQQQPAPTPASSPGISPANPPGEVLGISTIKRLPGTGFNTFDSVLILEIILILLGAAIVIKKTAAKR